jgi:hypothetical protein
VPIIWGIIHEVVIRIALTFYIVVAWFSVLCFACLPRRMPAAINVLLYCGLAIIDVNKITVLGYRLKLYEISKEVPGFLSVVINRDVIFSFAMLAFVNVYLTAETKKIKIIATVCTFFFVFSISQALRMFHVVTDKKWGIPQEIILISALMIISLLLGWLFKSMAAKEEQKYGQRYL